MNRIEIEETLWNYIDGLPDGADKEAIEAMLKTEPVWKDTYQELLSVQQLLQSAELEEPSMRFARNVMEEITKLHIAPATRTYINKNIIYGLGLFFVTMIVGLFVFTLILIKSTPSVASSAPFHTEIEKIDWSKLFDSTYLKIFLMVNTVLVLMFTDRYLTRRKQSMTNGRMQ